MPNSTIKKFGYPQTLVAEYGHWLVLLRPQQVTLGSLVLAAKSDATAYGALPFDAFAEQGRIVADIERVLASFCDFERINYLMLMMVDPHVHFHVIPRYSTPRSWQDIEFADAGWPGPPDLKAATALDDQQICGLSQQLRTCFAQAG